MWGFLALGCRGIQSAVLILFVLFIAVLGITPRVSRKPDQCTTKLYPQPKLAVLNALLSNVSL
jgi:hypothetical protein